MKRIINMTCEENAGQVQIISKDNSKGTNILVKKVE